MNSECYSIVDIPFASHKWEHEIEETANIERIKCKKKKLQTYSFAIRVMGAGLVSHDEAYNRMIGIFEADILTGNPGKLYVDEQFLECYVQELTADVLVNGMGSSNHTLKVIANFPFWIQKITKQFYPKIASYASGGLELPFDFPFDFAADEAGIAFWQVEHYAAGHFQMIIHGPCVNPRVLINGYPYQVFAELELGEYLIIDSRENTVTKYLVNGTTASMYNSRQFTPSIFEKIPAGSLVFNWTGTFGFDINLYLERSEPVW